MKRKRVIRFLLTLGLFLPIITAPLLRAHCDGMDGPVVKAAQKALETGEVRLVLIWVHKQDEEAVIKAFEKTLSVRKLSEQAAELADMYFFETLVRLHRAGEGAPYTGLKPAGRDLGPAIPAADRAVESGSAQDLLNLLSDLVREGAGGQFKEVLERKAYEENDVEKGRAYVQAYVAFVHYVERIYEAAKSPAHTHFPDSESGEATQ